MAEPISKKALALVAALVAVLSGGAGSGTVYLVGKYNPETIRPNPYTSLDAAEDFKKVHDRLIKLEFSIMNLPPKDLIANMDTLNNQLDRIYNKVSKIHAEQSRRTIVIEDARRHINDRGAHK